MAVPLEITVKCTDLPAVKAIIDAAEVVVLAHPDLPLVQNLRDAVLAATTPDAEHDGP